MVLQWEELSPDYIYAADHSLGRALVVKRRNPLTTSHLLEAWQARIIAPGRIVTNYGEWGTAGGSVDAFGQAQAWVEHAGEFEPTHFVWESLSLAVGHQVQFFISRADGWSWGRIVEQDPNLYGHGMDGWSIKPKGSNRTLVPLRESIIESGVFVIHRPGQRQLRREQDRRKIARFMDAQREYAGHTVISTPNLETLCRLLPQTVML